MTESSVPAFFVMEHALAEIEIAKAADAIPDLPPPRLWTAEEWAETLAGVDAASRAVPQPAPTMYDRPEWVDGGPETPTDLTDPLSHIRALLLPDVPAAAAASDAELEAMFDEWEARSPQE